MNIGIQTAVLGLLFIISSTVGATSGNQTGGNGLYEDQTWSDSAKKPGNKSQKQTKKKTQNTSQWKSKGKPQNTSPWKPQGKPQNKPQNTSQWKPQNKPQNKPKWKPEWNSHGSTHGQNWGWKPYGNPHNEHCGYKSKHKQGPCGKKPKFIFICKVKKHGAMTLLLPKKTAFKLAKKKPNITLGKCDSDVPSPHKPHHGHHHHHHHHGHHHKPHNWHHHKANRMETRNTWQSGDLMVTEIGAALPVSIRG